MKVKLDPKLIRDLKYLAKALDLWEKGARRNLERVYRKYGLLWQAEAKKRVPVEEGRLEKSILAPKPKWEGVVLTLEVGTNVKYAEYVEFGTARIAGGAVLALGDDPEITDLQAIHTWAAKEADAIQATSATIDKRGRAKGRLRNAAGRFVKGPQEQMPWLRPAFMEIKQELVEELDVAYAPPKRKR